MRVFRFSKILLPSLLISFFVKDFYTLHLLYYYIWIFQISYIERAQRRSRGGRGKGSTDNRIPGIPLFVPRARGRLSYVWLYVFPRKYSLFAERPWPGSDWGPGMEHMCISLSLSLQMSTHRSMCIQFYILVHLHTLIFRLIFVYISMYAAFWARDVAALTIQVAHPVASAKMVMEQRLGKRWGEEKISRRAREE